MPAGRLSLLTPEFIEQARSYLPNCVNTLPSVEGLALYLKVSRASIYNWAELGESKDSSDEAKLFLDIYEELLCERSVRLQNGGVYNRFNPTITKLLLSKLGYIEKVESATKHSNDPDNPMPSTMQLTDEELDERIKEVLKRRGAS